MLTAAAVGAHIQTQHEYIKLLAFRQKFSGSRVKAGVWVVRFLDGLYRRPLEGRPRSYVLSEGAAGAERDG